MSADLYTFHEAVSHLQEMEEDVLDTHKAVLDQIPKWHQACATLLAMTNEVDYDVDGKLGFIDFSSRLKYMFRLNSLCPTNGGYTSRSGRRFPALKG